MGQSQTRRTHRTIHHRPMAAPNPRPQLNSYPGRHLFARHRAGRGAARGVAPDGIPARQTIPPGVGRGPVARVSGPEKGGT